MIFLNRQQAGDLLAAKLKDLGLSGDHLLVLATSRGGVVVGQELASALNCPPAVFNNHLPFDLKDKAVILTDDGVVTGATMIAAVNTVRPQNPQKLIVAVPVMAKDALAKIEAVADEVIYLEAPEMFLALSQFYQEFPQITEAEVIQLLGNRG